jgi:ribosomal protein S18 acetylase RimI-like enzyme
MKTFIRRYKDSDRLKVINLWNEIFNHKDFHNDPSITIDMKVKHHDDLLFVAFENHLLIGTILVGFDGHRGWIYSLAVKHDYRCKRVGTSLVKIALQELRKLGCLKVNLQVEGDNESVVTFYEKNGFIVEDRISMGIKLY